jgi:hypothetical protein
MHKQLYIRNNNKNSNKSKELRFNIIQSNRALLVEALKKKFANTTKNDTIDDTTNTKNDITKIDTINNTTKNVTVDTSKNRDVPKIVFDLDSYDNTTKPVFHNNKIYITINDQTYVNSTYKKQLCWHIVCNTCKNKTCSCSKANLVLTKKRSRDNIYNHKDSIDNSAADSSDSDWVDTSKEIKKKCNTPRRKKLLEKKIINNLPEHAIITTTNFKLQNMNLSKSVIIRSPRNNFRIKSKKN